MVIALDNLKDISDQFKEDIKNQFDLRYDKNDLKYAILNVNQNLCTTNSFKRINGANAMENFITSKLLKFGNSLVQEINMQKNPSSLNNVKQLFRLLLLDSYDELINKKQNRVSLSKNKNLSSFLNHNPSKKNVVEKLHNYDSIIYC